MANTNFVDQETRVEASWLNAINSLNYEIFDGAVTKQQAALAIGAIRVQGNPTDGQVPAWDDDASVWVPVDQSGGGGGSLPDGTESQQVLTWDEDGQLWYAGAKSQMFLLQGPVTFYKSMAFNSVLPDPSFSQEVIVDASLTGSDLPGLGDYIDVYTNRGQGPISILAQNGAILYSVLGESLTEIIISENGSARIMSTLSSGNEFHVSGDIELPA